MEDSWNLLKFSKHYPDVENTWVTVKHSRIRISQAMLTVYGENYDILENLDLGSESMKERQIQVLYRDATLAIKYKHSNVFRKFQVVFHSESDLKSCTNSLNRYTLCKNLSGSSDKASVLHSQPSPLFPCMSINTYPVDITSQPSQPALQTTSLFSKIRDNPILNDLSQISTIKNSKDVAIQTEVEPFNGSQIIEQLQKLDQDTLMSYIHSIIHSKDYDSFSNHVRKLMRDTM